MNYDDELLERLSSLNPHPDDDRPVDHAPPPVMAGNGAQQARFGRSLLLVAASVLLVTGAATGAALSRAIGHSQATPEVGGCNLAPAGVVNSDARVVCIVLLTEPD